MSGSIGAMPVEAGALEQVRGYLRIEQDETGLDRLIAAAAELCEGFTGQVMLAREAVETLVVGAEWRRLPLVPARAIIAVEAVDGGGVASSLEVDAYAIDIDAQGRGWIRLTDGGSGRRMRVTYRAGLAESWAGLPDALRQGIVRLVAHLHAHRDAPDADRGGPPAAVAALWRPWRRMRLA